MRHFLLFLSLIVCHSAANAELIDVSVVPYAVKMDVTRGLDTGQTGSGTIVETWGYDSLTGASVQLLDINITILGYALTTASVNHFQFGAITLPSFGSSLNTGYLQATWGPTYAGTYTGRETLPTGPVFWLGIGTDGPGGPAIWEFDPNGTILLPPACGNDSCIGIRGGGSVTARDSGIMTVTSTPEPSALTLTLIGSGLLCCCLSLVQRIRWYKERYKEQTALDHWRAVANPSAQNVQTVNEQGCKGLFVE